ncbi:hypothetical protein Trydic_g3604 [Trypoxylus dichotomus]
MGNETNLVSTDSSVGIRTAVNGNGDDRNDGGDSGNGGDDGGGNVNCSAGDDGNSSVSNAQGFSRTLACIRVWLLQLRSPTAISIFHG